MFFTATRQFASNRGTKELKAMSVRLPGGSRVAEDGTVVYPATVWEKGKLLVLRGYYASIDGEIWSGCQSSLKRVSVSKRQKVGLWVDGKQRPFRAHRVVASTFLSGIRHADQNEVDHIDVDNRNGTLSNLRWATRAQNESNRCPTKAKAKAWRTASLLSKPIQQLDKNESIIAEFSSAAAAAASLGILASNISAVTAGRREKAGGFSWRPSPPEMTLGEFENRGFEVVGGIAEAPHLYFSADLKVYNDNYGKMHEIPIAHGREYPMIQIDTSKRSVHVVVAALRNGYKSLAEYDEFCAMQFHNYGECMVVMHDNDADKSDWWNCKIGTQKENSQDAVRNGCNTGKSAARPVVIRLGPDPASEIWKYDGVHDAVFSSHSEAARALKKYSEKT